MKKKAWVIAAVLGLALLLWALSLFVRLPLLGVNPHAAIPSHSALFFSLKNEQLQKLENGEAPKLLNDIFLPSSLKNDLSSFTNFFQGPFPLSGNDKLYISVHPTHSSGIDLLFISPCSRFFDLEGYLEKFHESNIRKSVFSNREVLTVKVGDESFSFSKYRNLLLCSRNAYNVENAISQLKSPRTVICKDEAFSKLFKQTRTGDAFHIYLNVNELPAQFAPLIEPDRLADVSAVGKVGSWLAFQIPEEEGISEWSLGFAPAKENTLLQASANSPEQDFKKSFTSLPENLSGFAWLSFQNFQPATHLDIWQQHFQPWANGEAILAVGEQLGDAETEKFFLLGATDASTAESSLENLLTQLGQLDNYDLQMFKVVRLKGPVVSELLGLGQMLNDCYVTVLGDYVVFANTSAGIDRWLMKYLAGQTFAKKVDFLSSIRALPAEAQAFAYFESGKTWQLVSQVLNEKQFASFPQNPMSFPHLSMTGKWKGNFLKLTAVTPSEPELDSKPVNILWQVPLAGNAVGRPAIFTNPENGEMEVLVRDVNDRVYLISKSGRILWRKDIQGPILSDFTQINLNNDQERQFVFSTTEAIHILDRTGSEVAGFPLDLQVPATNGVTVVDFFQSNDYQFFIACENGNAYGFDERGSPVEGWRPNTGVGMVYHPLVHFQAQGKDFMILLNGQGDLQVFRKNGSLRFPIVELESPFLQKPDYQSNSDYPRIVTCDDDGKVRVTNLLGDDFSLRLNVGEGESVKFQFSDVTGDLRKDYIALSGKSLAVFFYEGKKFGKASEHTFAWPQDRVFDVKWPNRRKHLIGTYSQSKKRIFLMDGMGKIPAQFPLEGTTEFVVEDLLGDGRHIIVTGNQRSVCAYALE